MCAGHLASQCPSDPTCYACGSTGHSKNDCPNREFFHAPINACFCPVPPVPVQRRICAQDSSHMDRPLACKTWHICLCSSFPWCKLFLSQRRTHHSWQDVRPLPQGWSPQVQVQARCRGRLPGGLPAAVHAPAVCHAHEGWHDGRHGRQGWHGWRQSWNLLRLPEGHLPEG